MIKKTIKRLIKDSISKDRVKEEKVSLKSAVLEESAIKRNLPVKRIDVNKVIVRINNKDHTFDRMNGPLSSIPLKAICDEKDVSRSLIGNSGVSVPKSKTAIITELDKLTHFAETVGYPVVIKPINSSRGRGVYTHIENSKDLRKKLKLLANELGSKYHTILIEKQYFGNDFRIYIIDGKIISVTKRERANVIGDGSSTVLELIKTKNKARMQNRYFKGYLIPTDKSKLLRLYRNGKSLDYVPERNEKVVLRDESNLSAGGDSVDYTDTIHPEYKTIILKAFSSIPGLMYGGLDIITEDITIEPTKENYVVTEVEFSPAPISMFPWAGKIREMGLPLIDFYISYFS